MRRTTATGLLLGLLMSTTAATAPAQAAQCIKAGGWGTGALETFAAFMAEAAMKNSAKARLGEAVKIGQPNTKCELKGLLWECNASARACK